MTFQKSPKNSPLSRPKKALTPAKYLNITTAIVMVSLVPRHSMLEASEFATLTDAELDALSEELGVDLEENWESGQEQGQASYVLPSIGVEVNPPSTIAQMSNPDLTKVEPMTMTVAPNPALIVPDTKEEWFAIGMVDYTLHRGFGAEVWSQSGMMGYYVDGVWGDYQLTSAANLSLEGSSIFAPLRGYYEPDALLARIDPNQSYLTYGDDSSIFDNAPSAGSFYLRLENETEKFIWGNFQAGLRSSEYVTNERSLYGAIAEVKSPMITTSGEPKYSLSAYASLPNTFPQRDVFRGTGGSVYFLDRADIIQGSEVVSIERRDPISGRVIEREKLTAEEYEIDYFKGTIILKEPLSAFDDEDPLFSDSGLSNQNKTLVVQYEYVPYAFETDKISTGGRVEAWPFDQLRLGLNIMNEPQFGSEQDFQITSADLLYRPTLNSFISAEFAKSHGRYESVYYSGDGGLTFDENGISALPHQTGSAWKIEAEFDLQEISQNADLNGRIGGYLERVQSGFASPTRSIKADEESFGVFLNFQAHENVKLELNYDAYNRANDMERREARAVAIATIRPGLSLQAGLNHQDIERMTGNENEGARTDFALRLDYEASAELSYFGYGQYTLQNEQGRSRADRLGAGLDYQIDATTSFTAEASYGTMGLGARAMLYYAPNQDTQSYIGYQLSSGNVSTDETGIASSDIMGENGIVFGQRQIHSDQLSSYQETTLNIFEKDRRIISAMGIDYSPAPKWTLNTQYEMGDVIDEGGRGIDHQAVSASIGYQDDESYSWNLRGEYRVDRTEEGGEKSEALVVSANLRQELSPDWRLIARMESVQSSSDDPDVKSSNYLRADLGFAYRPVDNDRLNALLKYSYVNDDPSEKSENYGQRSHVFSLDGMYDVNSWLSIGGKYGVRIGEAETEPSSGLYKASSAHLAVIRADIKFQNDYDFLLEYRSLFSPSAQTREDGALFAVYRDITPNLQAGIGYNFTSFSDDLTDFDRDNGGVFFNIVAKF